MGMNPWDITEGSEMFFQVITPSARKNVKNVDMLMVEKNAHVVVKILKIQNDERLCDHG
jgi:hypothetical protein